MTLMRLRELTSCARHDRVLITLDETTGPRRITFVAEADDARRLAREVRQGEIESSISCYPPDALTLALRMGVPIFATPDILRHAGTGPMEPDDTARWLERVRPKDFEP